MKWTTSTIVHIIIAICFVALAAFRYSRIDALLWMGLFILIAALSLFLLSGRFFRYTNWAILIVCLSGAVMAFPGFLSFMTQLNDEVDAGLKAQLTEKAYQFGGFVLAIVATLVQLNTGTKIKSKHETFDTL